MPGDPADLSRSVCASARKRAGPSADSYRNIPAAIRALARSKPVKGSCPPSSAASPGHGATSDDHAENLIARRRIGGHARGSLWVVARWVIARWVIARRVVVRRVVVGRVVVRRVVVRRVVVRRVIIRWVVVRRRSVVLGIVLGIVLGVLLGVVLGVVLIRLFLGAVARL